MKISRVRKPLLACLISIAAVIAAGAVAAKSSATRIEFEGFVHFCASGPSDITVTPGGQTIHIRDASNLNQWVTGNALIDGIETNTASAVVTPQGFVLHLFRTLVPDAYPGSSWEIVQTNHLKRDGSLSAHGVGHGTGALKGMTMKITDHGQVPGPNPCSEMNSVVIRGVIISPASHN